MQGYIGVRIGSHEVYFLLQRSVVFTDEVADLVGHPHELFPLLSIKRDREAPKNAAERMRARWAAKRKAEAKAVRKAKKSAMAA